MKEFCKWVLITNIVFWFVLAVLFTFAQAEASLMVKLLLFAEVVLYGVALYGFVKKVKWIYVLSILFAGENALLSITDQMGVMDVLSFVLSAAAFVCLLMVWKSVFVLNHQESCSVEQREEGSGEPL